MKNYTDHYNHIDPSAESKKRKTIYKLATETIYKLATENVYRHMILKLNRKNVLFEN